MSRLFVLVVESTVLPVLELDCAGSGLPEKGCCRAATNRTQYASQVKKQEDARQTRKVPVGINESKAGGTSTWSTSRLRQARPLPQKQLTRLSKLKCQQRLAVLFLSHAGTLSMIFCPRSLLHAANIPDLTGAA